MVTIGIIFNIVRILKAPEAKDFPDVSADVAKLTKEEFHAKYNDYFVMTVAEINDAKAIWDRFELKIWNRLRVVQPKFAYIQYATGAFLEAAEDGIHNLQGRVFLDFIKDDVAKPSFFIANMELF